MRWIRWWGMLLLTMLLIACGGGDGDRPRAKTTMLVYLVASDLIASAEGDLTHMLAAASSKDINVVLQVGGGSAAGSVAGVDLTQTVRYRLTPAAAPSNGRGWTLERLPQAEQPGAQVAMNKADTLRNFIQWGARANPSGQVLCARPVRGGLRRCLAGRANPRNSAAIAAVSRAGGAPPCILASQPAKPVSRREEIVNTFLRPAGPGS